MNTSSYKSQHKLKTIIVMLVITNIAIVNRVTTQCDPSTIALCEIGNNSVIQACYHAQIAKTSNGYSITGEDFAPDGIGYSTALTNIPSSAYPMPTGIAPIWGAIGGRTQAVFLGTDDRIYAIGEEDLLIDESKTNGPGWGPTSLTLPSGIIVCDVNKWQGTAGSGSDNNNNANTTGDRDGFLVFSTYSGEAYITGDGAGAIQSGASNADWTLIDMPEGVSTVNFGVGYRTLLIQGSDGNLYASGPDTYLGDGTLMDLTNVTLLTIQPTISLFGISQIEAGYNSYFVLDGDGTVHVLGENSEGALGVGTNTGVSRWSKVGTNCNGGVLGNVTYISTMSTHDNRINSSAILVNGTIRSWGSNDKQAITSSTDDIISCPITPTGNNRNAVAISNGGHISPYVNTNVQICNIGHNRQGAFGDGNDEEGDYGEYRCRIIPGMPEICGTKEADLGLEKTVNNRNPQTGKDIVFTITITNYGPNASTGSFVRDQLDPAFYYISDDSNGNYNESTGLWIVGPLDVGASVSLNITVKALAAGSQVNYAQILVDNEVDINSTPGDNSSTQNDDDLVILNIIQCPIDSSEIVLCPGDSMLIANDWIYETGTYIETIPVAFDCDSLHITHVLYIDNPPEAQFQVDCEALEYNLSVDFSSTWHPTWDNGDTNFETVYNRTTDQVILIMESDENCRAQQVVNLPPFPNLDDIPVIEDTTVLEFSMLEINTLLNPEEWQIQWSPSDIIDCADCTVGNITARTSTTVVLSLAHISGCTYESSFVLTVTKAPEHIYAPNIFTPDNNSMNSQWTISTTQNIAIEECNIYDRWGQLMYQSKLEIPVWDGNFRGNECTPGVYIYLIKYVGSNGESKVMYGDVTLIR